MTPYSVVFIDLYGASSAPTKRASLQQRLIALQDHLDQAFATCLVVPFQVVWGDEIKGIFASPASLWAAYRATHAFMNGTPFYFTAGLGTIDTPLPDHTHPDINMLDGTAFKAARNAMDKLKTQGAMPYRVRFATAGEAEYAKALNAFVSVLNDLVTHMTPAQHQHFVREYPWHQPEDQPNTVQVSRQAVWETLQRARIDAYKSATEGLEALLSLVATYPELVLPHGGDAS